MKRGQFPANFEHSLIGGNDMSFRSILLLILVTAFLTTNLEAQVAGLEIVGGEGYAETTITAQILFSTDLPTHGFSLGVSHDPAILSVESLANVHTGALLQALNGNSGPDFFEVNIAPAGGTGITVACITDLFSPFDLLPMMTSEPLIQIDYLILPDAPVGTLSPLTLTSDLGSPPVQTVMVLELAEVTPTMASGSILITEPLFIRGDLNQNGSVSLLDGVLLLYRVSGLEPPGSCRDADDINDDGVLTIGDAVYLFQYMFTGGAPIPGSDGTCNPDLTNDDPLDCADFLICD